MSSLHDPLSIAIAKKAAGQAAAQFIQDGMLIGLGTGSTTAYFIEALGQRCLEGLRISAVASSIRSTQQAQQVGIPLYDNQLISHLDLTIDGADEIDPYKNMIKGGGGALLREKLLAYSSKEMIVLVDDTKLVKHLGTFPLPIEIASFAYQTTLKRLEAHGYQGALRLNPDKKTIYLTDNGNYIFDIQSTTPILDPQTEHKRLKEITGVIETGLFFHVAARMVIGYPDGFVKIQA